MQVEYGAVSVEYGAVSWSFCSTHQYYSTTEYEVPTPTADGRTRKSVFVGLQ